MLGAADQHRAWIVPREALRDGMNQIEVCLAGGMNGAEIIFVDVAIP